MAVGIAANARREARRRARGGSVLPAWTRLRRPAARVCTLPIDKALQLSAATQTICVLRTRRKARYDGPTRLRRTSRRVTTEKPDRRVPGGLRIGAFLGPIPSSTGVRAASYATTEKPQRL